MRTLVELGIEEKIFLLMTILNIAIIWKIRICHAKIEKGPHLAYFGEIHPAITKLDYKDKNVLDLKFLKNIPEPNKN